MELTAQQKAEKAAKYAVLNDLLRQKHVLNERIAELMQEASQLRQRANEIDDEFHRRAIAIEPDEVVDIRKHKPTVQKDAAVAELLKRAQIVNFTPDLLEQLKKVLEKKD